MISERLKSGAKLTKLAEPTIAIEFTERVQRFWYDGAWHLYPKDMLVKITEPEDAP